MYLSWVWGGRSIDKVSATEEEGPEFGSLELILSALAVIWSCN